MAIISQGSEIFSIVKDGAICYEDTNFPSQFAELKNYYGDTSGASEQPVTKKYLSGVRIGVATERPQQTVAGKVYQHLVTQVEQRTQSGLFNWGNGVYSQRDAGVWVLVDDVTANKDEAAKLLNERVNAEQIAKDKRLNDILNSGTDPSLLGNGDGKDDKQTSPWGWLIAFLILIGSGLFFWKKKQKKQQAQAFQQRMSQPQSKPNFKTVKL